MPAAATTATTTSRSLQAPSTVVMVRPHHFAVNGQTAADNVFQSDTDGRVADEVAAAAFAESPALADALSARGVTVHLFDDDSPGRPDSVFPNNWFSTHRGGRVVTYPMYTANRRGERRADVIELLKEQYRVQDVIDYSGLEHDGLFLEETGAMVLDHIGRVAYVARSHRAEVIARLAESGRSVIDLSQLQLLELAGGSARCMLAGVHLDARPC